jgi:sugar phosphate permease
MIEAEAKSGEAPSAPLHYGWVIVLVGTLTIAACLGLARFAFGMLLPSMREALGMTYDEMGVLGTANFAGYLAAVALTPFLLRRFTPRVLIAGGLVLIAACMLGISAGGSYLSVLILYTLVGIGSGLANIPLMVLVSYWFRRRRRGRAAGLMPGGGRNGRVKPRPLFPLTSKERFREKVFRHCGCCCFHPCYRLCHL